MLRLPASSLLVSLMLVWLPASASADWAGLWLSPDQQGQRLFDQGEYAQAAQKFTTPEHIGTALFMAGEFESAAAVFGRVPTAEGIYNRGNALIMLGEYDAAITSYQQALKLRPGWFEAEQNLEIAELRKAALAPPDDDSGGTGGQLEADEIVFDSSGRVAKSSQEQTIEDVDGKMSNESLRAMWLRRVETSPADFLAAKFAYQLHMQSQAELSDD